MVTINKELYTLAAKNGFDLSKIGVMPESKLYSSKNINRIIFSYGISKASDKTDMSIGDIIGYDYEWRIGSTDVNILSGFENYFNKEGTNYQNRSIGMLDYSSDEVIKQLWKSFSKEPITVREADEGKFIIDNNGLHRYTILRLHYLNELSKASTEEEKQQVKAKYTIPVERKTIDYVKTYCNYLLDYFFDISLSLEVDENYRYTGKSTIHIDKKTILMDDNELIRFVRESLTNLPTQYLSDINEAILKNNCQKYPSFQKFIQDNLSDILEANKGRSI